MNNPQPISTQEYQKLLESLLAEGKAYAIARNIAAIPYGTDNRGRDLFIVSTDLAEARRVKNEGITDSDELEKLGFKVMKAHRLRNLYDSDTSDPDHLVWKPNPRNMRIALPVSQSTVILAPWGGPYEISAGGQISMPLLEYKRLAETFNAIRYGQTTAEEAFFENDTFNGLGKKAKFDVYGIEPGFLEKADYIPIDRNTELTKQFGKFVGMPRERYLAVLPETASFAKKPKKTSQQPV